MELDALLLRMMDLLFAGGHLQAAAPVDQVDLLGVEALAGAGGVHGGVAGPDHGDAFDDRDRRVHLRELIGLHQVGPGQVFVGRQYTDQVLAGNVHKAGQSGADADVDGVVALFEQLVQGDGPADDGVALDLDAESLRKLISWATIALGSRNSGMP